MISGYYINLNHRLDRKEHIENIIKNNLFFSNVNRMEGVLNDRGMIGCCLSHIKCLEKLLNKNENYYLVLEDDFTILDQKKFDNFVNDFEKIKKDNWDVITLTPYGKTEQKNFLPNFNKIIDNQTATGYIIKHSFAKLYLVILKKSYAKMIKGMSKKGKKGEELLVNDQCWKPLQKKYIFLYYKEIFGSQLKSFSDIEKKSVDYTTCFTSQIYR